MPSLNLKKKKNKVKKIMNFIEIIDFDYNDWY